MSTMPFRFPLVTLSRQYRPGVYSKRAKCSNNYRVCQQQWNTMKVVANIRTSEREDAAQAPVSRDTPMGIATL